MGARSTAGSGVGVSGWWQTAFEAAAALVLVAVFWWPQQVGIAAGQRTLWWVLAGLMVAGLLVRRARPVWALMLVAASTLVAVLLGLARDPFVAASWAVYTVAARHGPKRSVPMAAAPAAALVAAAVVVGGSADAEAARSVVVSVVVVAGAWLLGTSVNQERVEAAAAADAVREAAVLAERLRLSREVHDVISHALSSIAVTAGVGLRVAAADPRRLQQKLAVVEGTSKAALEEVRGLLRQVRGQPGLEGDFRAGFADLPGLIDRVTAAGSPTTLHVEAADGLPVEVQPEVYRVIQEALTNALRHAPGAPCAVTVWKSAAGVEPERVEVEVTNGPATRPVEPTGRGRGLGLLGLRERIDRLGGDLQAGPQPGAGFAVRARIPLGVRVGDE